MYRIVLAAAVTAVLAGPALAEPLPAPQGDVALTITGAVAEPNAGSEVALDLATIKGLGAQTIVTTTDWDWMEGKQEFAGTPAVDLLTAAGLAGEKITITAIDDYAVTMTLDDLKKHGAIIATSLNGTDLTDESFGPLWLVFPYDAMASAEEREAYKARSVWSIVKIDVE